MYHWIKVFFLRSVLDLTTDSSYTPPGSPPDANTVSSLVPSQDVTDKSLAKRNGEPVAMDTVAKETDDDEVLPAVEDALSELSPSKGKLRVRLCDCWPMLSHPNCGHW